MKEFSRARTTQEIVAKYLFAPNIQTSGAKAQIFKGLNGTTEEPAEKVAFEANCILQGLKPNTF